METKSIRFFLIAMLQTVAWSMLGQIETIKQKNNFIQLNLGLMHTRMMDEGYSKLLFRGTNWKYGITYGREANQYRFGFLVEAGLGRVKSKHGNLPSDFYFLLPSLEYLRKLRQVQILGKKSMLLAGLSLSSANYMIINQSIFDNASILSLHGAYLSLSCEMSLSERQRLQFNYQLPTAVYTNHLVWNGGAADLYYDDQKHLLRTLTTRGAFNYFGVLDNIQVRADYELTMKRNTGFLVGYKFRYANSSSVPPAATYSNELSIGLKIKF